MNPTLLQDAVGEIRDDMILDAANIAVKKHHTGKRWLAAAACLCLVLAGVLAAVKISGLFRRQPESSPVSCGVVLNGQDGTRYLPFSYNDFLRFGILPEGTPHLSTEKLSALCNVTAADLGAEMGTVTACADDALLGETAYRYRENDVSENICVISLDGGYEFFYRQESLRQENACAAYDLLDRAFGHDIIGNTLFPDDYAGAYIDGDRLVLLLTDTGEAATAKYREWAGEYAGSLTFKKAGYSYHQLMNGMQAIWLELESSGYTMSTCYVSETANKVVVSILPGEGIDTRKLETSLSKKYGIPVRIEVGAIFDLLTSTTRG